MTPRDYLIHFVEPNIKVVETAIVGDVAVSIAIKKLEYFGICPSVLECKISWKRAELV
jgi:hypothetical protein